MILSSILGIISGVGGSALTSILNLKTQKEKNKHELNLISAETNAMIAETESNIKIAEVKTKGLIEIADNKTFSLSQQFGNKVNVSNELIEKLFEKKWTTFFGVLLVFLLGIIDVIRSAMRPAITIVLTIVTTYITYNSIAIVMQDNSLFSSDQIFQLISSIHCIFSPISIIILDGKQGIKPLISFLLIVRPITFPL
jgi:hypothetical protein